VVILQRFTLVALALATLALATACAVNPVPTPASSGGFTFSPGQLDAAAGTDAAAGDAGALEVMAGVRNQEAGDNGEAAGDTTTAADTPGADATPDIADTQADTSDAKAETTADTTATDTTAETKIDTTKTDTTKPDTAPPPPTFGKVWTDVIQKYSCGSLKCHGPKGEPYLFQDSANAYGKLLGGSGGATYACGGKVYVVPGNPKASLLWQKIAPGVIACGDKMPVVIDGDGIDEEDAALVAEWIAAGAPP
jgi:hypothetical protein